MKKVICLLQALLILGITAQTQSFKIGTGASFDVAGGVKITIEDLDFEVDGSFIPNQSTVEMKGSNTNQIKGTNPAGVVNFHKLLMNKTGTGEIVLLRNLFVTDELEFIAGDINLNGNFLSLLSTGYLVNESEQHHIYGVSGEVVCNTSIPAGSSYFNPCNIGVEITNSQNMGQTLIQRGHFSWGTPNGNAIARYFKFSPTFNTNLDAILRFNYFDAELGSNIESELGAWEYDNSNTNFEPLQNVERNNSSNFVEVQGLDQLGNYTLAKTYKLGLQVKINLQGAMNGSNMRTSLQVTGSFPTFSPPSNYQTKFKLQNPYASITGSTSNVTDWVVVQLRTLDGSNKPTQVVASRAALLLKDGKVVDMDASSDVIFDGVKPGNYHVAVFHRNHLAVLTNTAYSFTAVN